ncbi:MAG: hypothetical protein QHJ73_02440, partial [Armatimonadota bacterium]|nr:hypothetical protein [Armatimonadota bacterium]
RSEFRGRKDVLVTHPFDRDTPCVLRRRVHLPAGRRATLRLVVSHHCQPDGDWDLVVRADGRELLREIISRETVTNQWRVVTVDLSPLAGSEVTLELLNQANGWAWEAAYWGEVTLLIE